MATVRESAGLALQHLIDPEICIRCNTCEETCPSKAITHDARNYVVDFHICNSCNACISPCPTGAIDNWRRVARSMAYSVEQQYSWDTLPAQQTLDAGPEAALPAEVARLTAAARGSQGAATKPPWSAAAPCINLYTLEKPAIATVTGNFRLTDAHGSSDVHHIVLDFGGAAFPVLEGQSVGILPPGTDAAGQPHRVRLYSIASPRNGERPEHNNISLTVKRVTEDHDGRPVQGVASTYLCALRKGEQVKVIGPYGASFLMPNHPGSSLLMVCTGTGSAPMRAMTEWRRRRMALKEGGRLMLFFGARRPQELPYFGPLMKLPKDFIDVHLAFSRAPDRPKTYVQDLIRARAAEVVSLLTDDNCYIYVCGLKGLETGVVQAFQDVCTAHGVDWPALHQSLLAQNRLHVETY